MHIRVSAFPLSVLQGGETRKHGEVKRDFLHQEDELRTGTGPALTFTDEI